MYSLDPEAALVGIQENQLCTLSRCGLTRAQPLNSMALLSAIARNFAEHIQKMKSSFTDCK